MLCKPPRGKNQIYWKKLSHCFSNMLISETYISGFEIQEKMVADNSKMARTITVCINL